MSNYKRKEVMDYLTRKPVTSQDYQAAIDVNNLRQRTLMPATSDEQLGTGYQTEVQPDMVIPPQDVLPKNAEPVMPFAPGIPDPKFRQLELAKGGRAKFGEGSKLTGTDKTLEENIREDHKAYNDYRKSIGSPIVPLNNEYIRMWIRSRLNSGGSADKQSQKIIPLDLESVAFKLFQDKLDNLSYNQKQTIYDYIEDNRNKKADGGKIKLQNKTEDDSGEEDIPILDREEYFGRQQKELPKQGMQGIYYGVKEIPRQIPIDPKTGREIESGNIRDLKKYLSSYLTDYVPEVGYYGDKYNLSASKRLGPFQEDNLLRLSANYTPNKEGTFFVNRSPIDTAVGYSNRGDNFSYGVQAIKNQTGDKSIRLGGEAKFAAGGRIGFKDGQPDTYNPEIPDPYTYNISEDTNPEVRIPYLISKENYDTKEGAEKIKNLYMQLLTYREEKEKKIKEEQAYKQSQKDKGIKYKEDFPSEAAYFAETVKQTLTNPGYFLSKGAKGAVEGTEWLIGQPLKILFNQEGKNFEFYHPVAGEKLGIDKLINKLEPKNATTGTLTMGEIAETAGQFADPFLAYGLAKGAIKGAKPKPPTAAIDETIDPTRRDILKTGIVMGGGAALYPVAKKIGMFDELAKGAKVVRVLPKVKGTPEWFSPLVSKIENEGLDITAQSKKTQKLEYEKRPISNPKDFEIIQSRKIELPMEGKNPEIITMTEYKNGTIHIESNTSGGAFNSPYDLYYSPPREVMETKYVRDKKGNYVRDIEGKALEKKVKVKRDGEFTVVEQRPFLRGSYEGDNALELEYLERNFDDSISDVARLEEFATGKKIDPKKDQKRKENKKYVEENPFDDAASRITPDEDRSYYDW